jgi:hypothetical protein
MLLFDNHRVWKKLGPSTLSDVQPPWADDDIREAETTKRRTLLRKSTLKLEGLEPEEHARRSIGHLLGAGCDRQLGLFQ